MFIPDPMSSPKDFSHLMFDAKPFLRTFSFREVLTSLAMALLMLALFDLTEYYSEENWLPEDIGVEWCFFAIVASHIIYYYEHNRSNNFIGRNLHDYIFALFYFGLHRVQAATLGSGYRLDLDGIVIIPILLSLVITIAFTEAFISLIKRAFFWIRWQLR